MHFNLGAEMPLCVPFRPRKLILVMKLTVLLTVLACVQVSAAGYSQKITVKEKNMAIDRLLDTIQQQSGYEFFYNANAVKLAGKASLNLKNVSVEEALKQLFKNKPFSYIITDKTIVISQKTTAAGAAVYNAFLPPPEVNGRVLDELGNPIGGATISVKGTNNAVMTDDRGYFRLKHADDKSILLISMIGFESKELAAKADIGDIRLKTAVTRLDAVQIIGYGTTSKRFNTGSVSTVKAEDIQNQPSVSAVQSLEGMVPGLFIQQGSGMAGGSSKVLLRGTNSISSGTVPLYIIDGVPFDGNPVDKGVNGTYTANQPNGETDPLNSVNPNDIESIEVLKDADATSIYGSRGANGVILITTKKAKKMGNAAGISGNIYSGITRVARLRPTLTTAQYLALRRQAFANDGVTPAAANAPDLTVWDQKLDNNFEKMLLGNTAPVTDASLSLSGEDANNGFLMSGSYHREGSVLPGNFSYHRGSFHAKAFHTSQDKKLRTEFSAIYSSDANKLPSSDVTSTILSYPNNYPLYNPNGSLYFVTNYLYNPLSLLRTYAQAKTTNLILNATLSYSILNNLKFRVNLGDNVISLTSMSIYPKAAFNPATATSLSANGTYSNNITTTYIAEPQLDYTTFIGKGKLGATVGGTYQHRDYEEPYYIVESGFSSDALITNYSNGSQTLINKSYSSVYNYVSTFGRLTYNWNSRYIINGTFRRDGSSKFGPGRQWGNFGSAGAAWLFSEERFMKPVRWLSFGKLRASYGTVGNDQISNYGYLDTYTTSGTLYGSSAGLVPSRIANSNYSWETSHKMEAGLELGFLNNNLLVNASVFRNRSGNLLVSYPLTGQTGFTSYIANINATVQNAGVELEVKGTPVAGKHFKWNTSFNISSSKNKLISFPGLASTTYASTYVIGQSLNIMPLYQFTGFKDGVAQFKDQNGDNQLSPGLAANGKGDYIVAGKTDPRFYGGFSNNLSYGNFQLDIFINFVKQKGYEPTAFPGQLNNQIAGAVDYGFKPSATTTSASYVSFANYYVYSTAKVADASFARLRNITLSYQLPEKWKKTMHMSNCRIYISGQNLITVTPYKGFDPETAMYNPVGFPTPLPASVFPPMKTITGGVQFSF